MKWDWIPGVRCGELVFGARFDAGSYSTHVELCWDGEREGEDWTTYDAGPGEATVSVSEGVIESVECWSSLQYRDHEIIGLSVEHAGRVLGAVPVRTDVWEGGSSWDIAEMWMTLWEEDGRVESATVWSSRRDDPETTTLDATAAERN